MFVERERESMPKMMNEANRFTYHSIQFRIVLISIIGFGFLTILHFLHVIIVSVGTATRFVVVIVGSGAKEQ